MVKISLKKENPRVLIVDDTPKNIQLLGTLLKEDYQINAANNGLKAIEMVEKVPPDLILLDVMMPEMDGHETCRKLKERDAFKDIPIIFLTAMAQPEDIIKGFELGGVDYITKPFNSLELKVRVKTHIDLRLKTLKLQELSERDGLTMIPNRRRFEESLDNEWRRCLRSTLPISLLMIDIDYFKLYNDNYGHLQGDDCLKKVATAIADTVCRPGDLAARYGGEEFAVILGNTYMEGAKHIAEKIVSNIEKLNLSHERSEVSDRITLSIGISTLIPAKEYTTEKLIQNADDSLYEAKEAGRNQIKVQADSVKETI